MAKMGPLKPVVSRSVAFGVVGLAVLLSGVGLMLAVQQSRAVVMGRIADLRPEAHRRIAETQREITRQLDEALRARAASRPRADGRGRADIEAPAWLGTVLAWEEGSAGDESRPTWVGTEGESAPRGSSDPLEVLVRSRVGARMVTGSDGATGISTGYLHDVLAGRPVVMVYRADRSSAGAIRVVAASLDLGRLRDECLTPRISGGGDLALVDLTAASEDGAGGLGVGWSETLAPMFPFWAVEPSESFVARQKAAGVRQTVMYAGLMVLALAALLVVFRALNRVVEHEVALSRLKSDFVADVSHELKTPLALIRMFGETLLEGRVSSPEKAHEYYAIIHRESTRLTHLINNILDFARIDAGKKQYRFERVDVGRVVRETYESYRHELDRLEFEHECTVAENLPEVEGDGDAIGQVVLNLIGNAMKYSDDEKYLGVDVARETRRGKHGVLISVRDRGIGIRPEDRAHLFDGFFRAPDERVRRRRGAGLGLALCKQIVDAHGGCVDVESRLVKGSTFRVFLPQRAARNAHEGAK